MDITLLPQNIDAYSLKKLGEKWTNLEAKSDNASFFISWFWIGTWLSSLNEKAWLLEVTSDSQIIALGIFIERKVGIWPFNKTQLWLNKTGQDKLDQIWIEYNDFVIHRDCNKDIKSLIWNKIFEFEKLNCQEIHVDISKHKLPKLFCGRNKMQTKGFLKLLSKDKQELLADLSKNTRHQINRSKRILEQQGNLSLIASSDYESRKQMLDQIGSKHKEQWGITKWGSGFDNPAFCHFHENLIQQDKTILLRLLLDNRVIAQGYYFYYHQTVYFYLSAIEQTTDNRIKHGLVFHTMAMDYFQKLGFEQYDFLGGDARYKASLSDYSYPLYSWCLARDNWLTKLESTVRKIRGYNRRTEL